MKKTDEQEAKETPAVLHSRHIMARTIQHFMLGEPLSIAEQREIIDRIAVTHVLLLASEPSWEMAMTMAQKGVDEVFAAALLAMHPTQGVQ